MTVGKISVLMVEDDVIDAETITRALSRFGTELFRITHVTRLRDALLAADAEVFHAVILDLGLPDSSGLRGFKQLFEKMPDTPVVILSGWEDEDGAIKAIELGAQEFIYKEDVEPQRLIRSIRHAIKRKQSANNAIADSAQSRRLEMLNGLIKNSSEAVCDGVGELRSTRLDDAQTKIVAHIERVSREAVEKAQALDSPAMDTTADVTPERTFEPDDRTV